MTDGEFWAIIDGTCGQDRDDSDAWFNRLKDALMELPPEEIVAWDEEFHRLLNRAHTVDLWGAAYLINGGASDDGFYYFRCWLIGMGREVYEKAVADPDTLADFVQPDVEVEAEIYSVGHVAWQAVTGKSDEEPYPCQFGEELLQGEDWDYDDDSEVRARLPRLAELCLEA